MPVESFNDRAPTQGAPTRLGSRGASAADPDGRPGSAKGMPAGVRKADGTENLGTGARTLQAGDSRAHSSSGKGPTPPQHFNDSAV